MFWCCGCRSAVSLGEALDDHRHALAATDAHRLEADGAAGVLEAVEQRGHDAGAGHAERVAEGDGAAVDVQLVVADAELAGGGHHLGGERLVDLDEVDVIDGHAGPAQRLADGLDRAEAHDLGIEGAHAGGDDPADAA